jgi:hypothetical protein
LENKKIAIVFLEASLLGIWREMKKLLLSVLILSLSGCFSLYKAWMIAPRQAMVSMKDGVPCFSNANNTIIEGIHRGGSFTRFIFITEAKRVNEPPQWRSKTDNVGMLSSDQCIPYTGEEELKKDTMYVLELYYDGKDDIYNFGASFCMTEAKDGETVVHQYNRDEPPAICPPSGVK